MAVERVLRVVQGKIANYLSSKKNLQTDQPIVKGKYGIKDLQGEVEKLTFWEDVAAPGAALIEDDMVKEKNATIMDLRETIELMELKMRKLEQLVKIKDNKI